VNNFFSCVAPILFAWLCLAFPCFTIAEAGNGKPSSKLHLATDLNQKYTPPKPGSSDAQIAQVAARILQQAHFLQREIDPQLSRRFIYQFMDSLDFRHLDFLQSDIEEFEPLASVAGERLLMKGDASPAYLIFARYMQRLNERVLYVTRLLETEKMDFSGNDRFVFDRRKAPHPANMGEAQKLWRDSLRNDVLLEKLGSKKNSTDKPEEIAKKITLRYQRMLRLAREMDSDEVFQRYLTALAQAYDPHSDYMGRAEMQNFMIGMKLSLVGIGALLSSEDGYCIVKELIPGGPAAKQNILKPQDRIVAVGQGSATPDDVIDMNLNKVVEKIRGKKGTEVRLTVIPADTADPSARKIISIIRDEVKLEDKEAKAKIYDIPYEGAIRPLRICVIDLPSFYADFDTSKQGTHKSTTTDVAKLLSKAIAEGANGVILDLRMNGGGSLEEAINLTGLFIPKGPVVQVRNPRGEIQVQSDRNESVLYSGPLMVLTSRFSASASEIVAGALQDYGRAVVAGDSSTHGKGTVQSLIRLDDFFKSIQLKTDVNPGALKLTVQKFYRASGSSTQLKGVSPHVLIPSLNDQLEVGERYLDYPMAWDEINPARFVPLNWVQPFIPELKKLSATRIQTNKDFEYLLEDIAEKKRRLADKSISLNEKERIQEKNTIKLKKKQRKEERMSRNEPSQKLIVLSLKDVDKPGLPDPTTLAAVISASQKDADDITDDEKKEASEDIELVKDLVLDEAIGILADLYMLNSKSSQSR